MLIDWITARISYNHLSFADVERLRLSTDRIMRYCPRTGDTRFESSAWDSVRSDSHNLSMRPGSDALWIQGSPARVCGDGDAVFGSGPSAALDLVGCLRAMAVHLAKAMEIRVPDARLFQVSRVDVTANYALEDLADVRAVLAALRQCEGGRYRVSQQAGDSVYWRHRSRLSSGKAYAKGPHLDYLMRKKDYTGRRYSATELQLSRRLLRLEMKIGAQWFREKCGDWREVTAERLRKLHSEFFGRQLGSLEVAEMGIEKRVREIAETDGRARAALACWALIQAHGWEHARELHSRPTWYRHLKILREAGLGDADLSTGQVLRWRRPFVQLSEVSSWNELKRAA